MMMMTTTTPHRPVILFRRATMMMTGARQHGTTTAVPTSSSSSPASMAATPQPPRSKPFFTAAQRARFEEDGFVVVEHLIDPTVARAIRDRFPLLFRYHPTPTQAHQPCALMPMMVLVMMITRR